MDYFLDTSALVKSYRAESGSARMTGIIMAVDRLYVSPVTEAELLAMLARWRKQQPVARRSDFDEVIARARRDLVARLTVVRPTRRLFEIAAEVALSGDVRGCDAFQLAAALFLRETFEVRGRRFDMTFVAADLMLLEAAASRGFKVENPRDAPDML